jgi:hypothetical protein
VTLDGTGTRYAVVADHPHAWAGSALLTLRPRWAGRSRRTDRTHRTGVSLGALRSRGTGIALLTLPAGCQAGQQRHRNDQMGCAHFQILPVEPIPCPQANKTKLGSPPQG